MELRKQKTYKSVFDIAKDRLLLGAHLDEQLFRAGLRYEKCGKDTRIYVPFFNDTIIITLPQASFVSETGANVTLVARIIILHYINTAAGIPLSGEKTAYGDIPACMHYDPVFEKRVLKPLIRAFGYDRHSFIEAGRSMGAREEEYGDASFTLFAFPKVPLTFILWEGDEEFPPQAKTLFDPSVTGYLPLEDIVVIAKLAAGRILKSAKATFDENI